MKIYLSKMWGAFYTLLIVFTIFSCKVTVQAKTVDTNEVVSYINALRGELGLPAFSVSNSLTEAAQIRANELPTRFEHIRPDGTAWYTAGSGINGENLAWADTEEEKGSLNIVAAWYYSTSHRANLLGKSTQIGIACYDDGNGNAYIACEFN